MRAALPAVHAASAPIKAAMPGGTRTFSLAARGVAALPGAPAGVTASLAGAATGAGSIHIDMGGIHSQGGTFRDRQSIRELAHEVSEEIMRSVRMQGGLLLQL
jgi:hypothetical protein